MSDFVEVRLGDLAIVKSGFAFKSKDFGDHDYAVVKIANIKPPRVDLDSCQKITSDCLARNNRAKNFELKKGDILIAMTGATAGKIGRVPETTSRVFLNQRVGKVFLRNPESASYEYIYYFLSQKYVSNLILQQSDGSAQGNISGQQIEQIKLPLPPLKNQKAIAHILGTLDDKIELNQKMNQTLEEIAKAIFKSWFVDFDPVRAKAEGRPTGLPPEISDLFPDELVNSEIGEIPKGWEVAEISAYGRVICGKTPSTKDPENFDGEFPFITIPDMRGNLLSIHTERSLSEKGAASLKGKMLPAGSICVSCIATPGLVSVTTSDSFSNQQINSIVPRNEVDREYLLFSMMTLGDLISSAGSGGSVFANLSTGRFKGLPILKPCKASRNAFSTIVCPMLQRVEISQKEISTLSELRDTLLPKLISGELRIPDAEKFLKEAGI